jgi:hypothetical protein
MSSMSLQLEIAHCPVMARCLDAEHPSGPCAAIVCSQWDGIDSDARRRHWRERHQLPEPWVGHLDEARILFVSSNPSIRGSISLQPGAPPPSLNWNSAAERLTDRYECAFELFIEDGVREHGKRATAFWAAVKLRAHELLGRPPLPGSDYVLTEVVHCKSRKERGVNEARTQCSKLYLERVIEQTPAPVVVFLGAQADRTAHAILGVSDEYGRRPTQRSVVKMSAGGRDRMLAFLPHPNFRGVRTPAACWTPDELQDVRTALD